MATHNVRLSLVTNSYQHSRATAAAAVAAAEVAAAAAAAAATVVPAAAAAAVRVDLSSCCFPVVAAALASNQCLHSTATAAVADADAADVVVVAAAGRLAVEAAPGPARDMRHRGRQLILTHPDCHPRGAGDGVWSTACG